MTEEFKTAVANIEKYFAEHEHTCEVLEKALKEAISKDVRSAKQTHILWI